MMVGVEIRSPHRIVECQQHLPEVDLGRFGDRPLPLHLRSRLCDVTLHAFQRVHVFGGSLESLVFLESANQFRAGIVLFLAVSRRSRQQHSRLDLGQRRRHDQVFSGQFELHVLHELDVARVLDGDFGYGNVEDIQVLPPDQIQQQIQRAFEGFEKDLESVGRDIEIPGQLGNRFALNHREGHLTLPGIAGLAGDGRSRGNQLEPGFG